MLLIFSFGKMAGIWKTVLTRLSIWFTMYLFILPWLGRNNRLPSFSPNIQMWIWLSGERRVCCPSLLVRRVGNAWSH